MDPTPELGLVSGDVVSGAVDYSGKPAARGATGRWRSAGFVLATEVAERFAFKGVSANLIMYLTGPLHESTAAAAAAVNAWHGVATMLPLPAAALADAAGLGRFRAVIVASFLFLLGIGMLTLSASLPSLPARLHTALFYVALYTVAVAEGFHKPCAQAFAADQFDSGDAKESVARSSFFNYWYCGMCGGAAATTLVSSYVQDNVGWGLGFGIPLLVMLAALAVFLLGSCTYRYYSSSSSSVVELKSAFKNLAGEEARGVARLFPIWATCLLFAVVFSQSSTFFTKQAATLDRRVGKNLKVPPAALQAFISITIVAFIPLYDRLFVPFAKKYSHLPSGITMLQRIGTGLLLSVMSVAVAAAVESKRLRVARDAGLVDLPKAPLPMSLWWLLPQYILLGVADVFAMIGLQEFFYDQVPARLRSLGLALFLSIFGVGHFLSSLLISAINAATTRGGGRSWFADNLNRAHLDYFYCLLAGLGVVELLAFLYFSRIYVYKGSAAVKKSGEESAV